MNNYLITIGGPTAIGKTSLSIALAKHYNAEIISCDSRQFYKEMEIGTAVPDEDELTAATHHFIQHKSIHDYYNVRDFETDAIKKLNELFKNNNIAIMVGGSGLYANAVLYGLDDIPEVDMSIREELNTLFAEQGLTPLQEKLKILDPVSYHTIAIDNPQRLIRAVEVSIGSGKPYSSFLNQKDVKRNFIPINISLTADREIIYDRINKRVDIMVEIGLVDEVKSLVPFKKLNALNTVGYKELFDHLAGEVSLEEAIELIKRNTRRFAKRQLTWFKKDKSIEWFDYQTDLEKIIQHIDEQIKNACD
ncbi:MAG: tRNA (adenosine(37)-N6)-dimethylallyltransferase MiaA [Flavobacteriaceae bacterium]|nr:tRNA (adenosine(37)-N6)-dimethylallyltransferase MiaA [Flavobacteriaceae bacterium]